MSSRNKYGVHALGHLASQTGGTDYDALHTDLPAAFEEIGNELRSLYSLGYHSTNKSRDDTFRKVVIRARPDGLTVRTKTGYYSK